MEATEDSTSGVEDREKKTCLSLNDAGLWPGGSLKTRRFEQVRGPSGKSFHPCVKLGFSKHTCCKSPQEVFEILPYPFQPFPLCTARALSAPSLSAGLLAERAVWTSPESCHPPTSHRPCKDGNSRARLHHLHYFLCARAIKAEGQSDDLRFWRRVEVWPPLHRVQRGKVTRSSGGLGDTRREDTPRALTSAFHVTVIFRVPPSQLRVALEVCSCQTVTAHRSLSDCNVGNCNTSSAPSL